MPKVEGLSPDQPIATNEKGGKQSATPYGFHLLDAKAMFRLAGVMQYGATRYERDNWRKISAEDHLNHAMQHAFGWMAGDDSDDHAGHFLCRAMMFCAMVIAQEEEKSNAE